MARWYVLQGPHATREQAEGAYAAMDRNHTRLRVAKLRDRTGPSLRERVAELEADTLDLRTRIGDLEREPAPVRPEPGSMPLPASVFGGYDDMAANPYRMAEGAQEPTDEELGQMARAGVYGIATAAPWFSIPAESRNQYIRAGKAIYSLGREHGRADADAAIDLLRGEHTALRSRAEQAEAAVLRGIHARVRSALQPFSDAVRTLYPIAESAVAALVADWQKRGEELEALRAKQAERSRDPFAEGATDANNAERGGGKRPGNVVPRDG